MDNIEPYFYVCLRIFPEPTPRWFILHQRLLKPVPSKTLYRAPLSSSSFVSAGWGVYVIGGLINGKPTSDVSFYDCFKHKLGWIPPMKTARASASASLIDDKIYVFGGCGNEADSSNWAEVFDLNTRTWDSLFVNTPKMPLNIRHSVVLEEKEEETEMFAVDEDGQDFSFSPSKCMFWTSGKSDYSTPGYTRHDWCVLGTVLFSRATGGRIMWCLPEDLDWVEVKGLEELQHSISALPMVAYDINKLCINYVGNIVIFWNSQPHGSDSLELRSAEISVEEREEGTEVWGKVEWSDTVLKLVPLSRSCTIDVLFADSVNA